MASPDASNVSGLGLEDHDFAGWVGYYSFTLAGTIDEVSRLHSLESLSAIAFGC